MKKLMLTLGVLFAGTAHAQSSVSGDFGANVAFAGPNPYYDLSRYGLYQGSGAPITCSITAGTSTLRCGRGIGDFAVGQGIEIPLAGPVSTFEAWGTTAIDSYSRSGNMATYHVKNVIVGPPQTITITGLSDASFNGTFTITSMDGDNNHFTAANVGANVSTTAGVGLGTLTSPNVVVTPSGILNGSTRYDYKVVLRDYNGALSAASPAGTTLVGAARLGSNTINVGGCTRTSGVVTCTTTATHNLQFGATIVLAGTSTNFYDGQHQVASTPSGTTFTYSATGITNDPNPPSGGTITVVAKNTVQWNMQQYKQLQAFIYRSINSGAYSLIGITEGMDGAFVDWNVQAAPTSAFIAPQAAYISTTNPTAVAVNGILASRITGISGTTLTISAHAVATATSQPAAHDNSPVVIAACIAIGAGGSAVFHIPGGPSLTVPFNSVLNLRDNCAYSGTVNKLRLNVDGGQLLVNEPIVARDIQNYFECVGGGGPLQSLSTGITCEITGNAYPLVYVPKGLGPTTMKNFLMDCFHAYQSCVVEDQDSGHGGTVNTDYDNVYFNGSGGSMPFIERGGAFFHRWERGGFTTGGSYAIPEALLITIPNALGLVASGTLLGGNMMFNQTTFLGRGVLYESWGQPGQSVGFTTYKDNLYESGVGPLIRFNLGRGSSVQGLDIVNPAFSDAANASTPIIELGGNGTNFFATRVFNPLCNGDTQPIFAGGGGGIELIGSCPLVGATQYVQHTYFGTSSSLYAGGATLGIKDNGYFFTQMANPLPVVSLVASAGGSVPNGTRYYSIAATDLLGNSTLTSSQAAITTKGENGTVTITPPTLPVGATGYRVYRNDGPVTITGVLLACGQLAKPILPGVPFVDTLAVPCGNSAPLVNYAGTTILNSTGYSGPTVTLVPTAFANLGTPVNGTFYYCNDCTVANPCAGGGTGALAKRLNGVWVCN
jgi:hypothetical protein